MHDTTLLQLIEDDIGPAEQLLQLLRDEYVALHGRDMPVLENILAHKQSLVVLLDQQGRRRSQLLTSIGLTADRAGVEVLASQSHLGPKLLQQLDVLGNLLNECKEINERNGQSIVLQQATTANQIRILMGGEAPSLYDSRGSTSPLAKPRALSQAGPSIKAQRMLAECRLRVSFLPGDSSTVLNDVDAPQPPKVLTTPLEIAAHLRTLLESHDPLIITFHERSQRFQSYVVEVDRDSNVLALDEMIPRDGERFLENGEPFRVEGFHDGVRIAWECDQPMTVSSSDSSRCYRGALPTEVTYHQRRNAFRAALKLSQLVDVVLDGEKLKGAGAIRGKLLDISATGCKLRFEGNIEERLQLGQVYEKFAAGAPLGLTSMSVELRHLHFEERQNITFAGVRFHNVTGQMQRKIESFVYQLQREARRFDKDDY